jgi:hypothetical protein
MEPRNIRNSGQGTVERGIVSDQYIRKLGRIRDEYQAAAGALAYVSVYWYKQNIFNFSGLEAI